MQHHRTGHNLVHMLVLSVVLVGMLAAIAFAKKEPITYPEEGQVIGTGTTEHSRTNGYTHTYKVQTATKVFELDCGKEAVFHSTGPECLSGGKPIQVGDVIHFRIEKDNAYIPLPDQNGMQGEEEKLHILSAEAAGAKKETPSAPAP